MKYILVNVRDNNNVLLYISLQILVGLGPNDRKHVDIFKQANLD